LIYICAAPEKTGSLLARVAELV